MTNQELFNKAYLGLKGQGFKKSVFSYPHACHEKCAYRGYNGLKCAAGHIFTDEQLQQYKTKRGAPYEGQAASIIAGTVEMEVDRVFLDKLQGCHDNSYNAQSMELNLTKLAKDNGLTVPE